MKIRKFVKRLKATSSRNKATVNSVLCDNVDNDDNRNFINEKENDDIEYDNGIVVFSDSTKNSINDTKNTGIAGGYKTVNEIDMCDDGEVESKINSNVSDKVDSTQKSNKEMNGENSRRNMTGDYHSVSDSTFPIDQNTD